MTNDEMKRLVEFWANMLIVIPLVMLVVFFLWWKAEDNGVALVGVGFNVCALIYGICTRPFASRL